MWYAIGEGIMGELIVSGGARLSGEIEVHGSKNAALPIMAATLLVDGPVELVNCPRLVDVENMRLILEAIGCTTRWDADSLLIDPGTAARYELPEHTSKELRSSIFLLGSVLARFGVAVAAYPGGCDIGNRPIDLHLDGLKKLGADITEDGGRIRCEGSVLRGAAIHLDYPSVGATENIMLAACRAEGETVIHNAAREPEIEDLGRFLCAAGFFVRGAGTSTVLIRGSRTGGRPLAYRIMQDRIVAGTYLVAAAITCSDVLVRYRDIVRLSALCDKLRACGATLTESPDGIRLRLDGRPKELLRVETLPYPGFPTDMQAQVFSLCQVARGTSVIVENVFENRFRHAQELLRMGGSNYLKGTMAVIRGVERLHGATVQAHDLRGGAALVLAGLAAEGETVIEHAERIDRGYVALETALGSLGATVIRKDNEIVTGETHNRI